MGKINKNFFKKNTIEIACDLLGCYLVHETLKGKTVGKIVETEAYLQDDEASHSFKGKTKRNEVMFEEAGKAYIYFIYGAHHCFNVVTNKKGIGEAVLIRALEPISGIKLMKKRRKINDMKQMCNGPGKLVEAMGIKKEQNGINLLEGKLRIELSDKKDTFEIVQTKRVRVKKGAELEQRFYIKDSEYVSRYSIKPK